MEEKQQQQRREESEDRIGQKRLSSFSLSCVLWPRWWLCCCLSLVPCSSRLTSFKSGLDFTIQFESWRDCNTLHTSIGVSTDLDDSASGFITL